MRVALIDCENLTGFRPLAAARQWAGWDRVELFGRLALVQRWRRVLDAAGIAIAAEILVADDAPSQAADECMAARVLALIAAPFPPSVVAIASNDLGFGRDIARLGAAGIAARQHKDPGDAEILALIVAELGGHTTAAVAGDMLWQRFRLRLNGRVDALATKAGLTVSRTGGMIRLSQPSGQ